LALALTGSSTCTLIAFVFPALLFVQAAKEAQGKSDETVRVHRMYTPARLKHCALLLPISFSWGWLMMVVSCVAAVRQPPPANQVRMAMAAGIAGCIFGTIATIAVLQHGSAGGHGRRLAMRLLGDGE
jgi:FtsH-binding integral membrane protein